MELGIKSHCVLPVTFKLMVMAAMEITLENLMEVKGIKAYVPNKRAANYKF